MNRPIYNATPEEVKALQSNSKERLESARALLKIGNHRDSISRSYYAILDAARGLLLIHGFFAKTHDGAITLFNLKFIKTKKVAAKYGRIFREAEKSRVEADYRFLEEFSKKEAEHVYRRAKEFVAMVNQRLGARGKKSKKGIALTTVLF